MNPQRSAALMQLLANKIHIWPDAADVPTGEALQSAVACVRPWPTRLLDAWAAHPAGHLVIGPARGYAIGPQAIGRRTLVNVAWVALADVSACSGFLLSHVAHLLDHLLGCGGDPAGGWLSDGSGVSPAWQTVGQRLHELFRLGYGPTPAAQTDAHAYFAWGFALYWHDRPALNVRDPRLERLLRTTLFSDGFWRSAPLPQAGPPATAR